MRKIRIGSMFGAQFAAMGLGIVLTGCTSGKGDSADTAEADSQRGGDSGGDSAQDSAQDSDSAGDSGDSGDTGIPARGAWTFLVYMVGDNDLETAVQHDLNELERGWPDQGVQAIVLADRAEGYADDGGDWTNTRLYRIGGDDTAEVRSELVADWGERDMADPATLEEFLLWAADHAPAERYALALWDHGTGWYLTGDSGQSTEEQADGQAQQGAPPPGIGWDESSGAELSIAEGDLAAGLEAFVAREGRLDVVAFDACNMASFEVGYALMPYADHLVAAQTTVGMEGLQYDLALATLTATPGMDGARLAVEMAAAPVEVAGEWTFSAVDLAALAEVREALDAVADRAMADPAAGAALLSARSQARGSEPGDRWRLSYMDFADLAAQVEVSQAEGDGEALAEAAALRAALSAAVIGDFSMPGFDWTGGLNLYADTLWLGMYHGGPGATWAQDGRWDDALLWIADQEQ